MVKLIPEYETLTYETGQDLAQSTAFQNLIDALGNDNDEAGSGVLKIFNPSSTTYVKHFIATRGVANMLLMNLTINIVLDMEILQVSSKCCKI
jgi:hypothetical protein